MSSPKNWNRTDKDSLAVMDWEHDRSGVVKVVHTGQAYVDGYDVKVEKGYEEGLIETGITSKEEARKTAVEWMRRNTSP